MTINNNCLLKRLNDFRMVVGNVKKNAENPFHKSRYATIESVLDTIEEPLNSSGIGYYQKIGNYSNSEIGKIGMCLETILYSLDNTNDSISSIVPLINITDMQKLGSAITYARRYGLVSILGLEQEDDDANLTIPKYKNNECQTNRATIKKILKLSDVPYKNGVLADKTWQEILEIDTKNILKISNYISWFRENKNIDVILDDDFQNFTKDIEGGF